MQQQSSNSSLPGPNFVLFIVLSLGILLLNVWILSVINPPRPKPADQAKQAADENGEPVEDFDAPEVDDPALDDLRGDINERPPEPAEDDIPPQPDAVDPDAEAEADGPDAAPPRDTPSRWVTLGSVNPRSEYRMLVTLTSRGAAVLRAELGSERYRDLEFRGAYIGHLIVDEKEVDNGCPVQVVGPGTPADEAGIQVGDRIVAVGSVDVDSPARLREAMRDLRPGRSIEVVVRRSGEEITLPIELRRRPLEVIRPEANDPLSMLVTLHEIDGQTLPDEKALYAEIAPAEAERLADDEIPFPDQVPPYVTHELPGIDLRTGNWELLPGYDSEHASFRRELPRYGIELIKQYRLAKVPEEKRGPDNPDYPAYHLDMELTVRNMGEQRRKVAYQLDGPAGLPTEGWWYANKIGREGFFGGNMGLRDVLVFENEGPLRQIGCPTIAEHQFGNPVGDQMIKYIGGDAQYFSAVMIPQKEDPEQLWFARWEPLRVSPIPADDIIKLTNTTFRVVSQAHELSPDESIRHEFQLFIGPKKPSLLAKYDLGEVVYYGWFGFIAKPMLDILHFLHDNVVFNYGLAIILLTVLVRGAMYPLSRKQVEGAQKMQELQPELKKLQEKYKKDPEARTKAQQELFRKHNYNPFSGCLVLFIQFPIFIALYRSLMVDVELRQAPLFTDAIRWCSNLAAPDMLYDWSSFMPEWVNNAQGMLGLGPYFNLLPIVTVFLFIAQQKMFMPPATDDQTRMQQKMMQFMMVFIGIMFFKVASGLCIYFIATSVWGVAERKLLPKSKPKSTGPPADEAKVGKHDRARPQPRSSSTDSDKLSGKRKVKKRGKRR